MEVANHLVALTPSQVPIVQQDLVQWCTGKCVALGRELARARQNLAIVKDAGWQRGNFVREISRLRSRMIYFAKIRAAVAEGYLVVPNFPVEVMALRVDKRKLPSQQGYNHIDLEDAGPAYQRLPPGKGTYVGNRRPTFDASYDKTRKDGTTERIQLVESFGYDDPDFPVRLIKPEVLDATRHAMALKVFDRIGVVTGRKSDPVVVGQILDPRSTKDTVRMVTFFIAWWLDPESL